MSNKANLNSIKASGLEIVNDLSTSGTLNFCNGYLFLGESYHENVNEESTPLPPNSYMGTSETRGNVSRDEYNINTNGPIQFGGTDGDKQQIVKKFSNITATNPVLTSFPWLYPLELSWTSGTQVALGFSETFPIYKCLGKGLGDVEFYKVSSLNSGDESAVGNTVTYATTGITCGNRQKQFRETLYPFNGKIYAGTLVELITEIDETTGIKETKVLPYQSGRGIPLYAQDYEPEDNTPLTPFAPFGELKWPVSDNTMSPSLASGIEPGDSNKCVGIVLDTFSSTIPNQRLFKYKEPTGFTSKQLNEDPHDPWYNHPAPYTVPAVSVKNNLTVPNTQGFLSPGPNLAGTYWAPWPDYYAYQPGDPIPVLTKGITTARIGAAYNVALTSYGIRQQISATDESWVPISTIPMFQGERLEAGSYIYSSVKGMIVTPGADVTNYKDPASNQDTSIIGLVGQTSWDFFVDSTWGNIGWTGTPGLSFTNIPDSTTSIMEVLKDQNGNVKNIPYLNQSNQGSIIVHPVSNVQPEPALGNAYLQRQNDNAIQGLTEAEKHQIYIDRFNLPGVSGRCMLPQPAPEKCQPIGIMLETIIGQGKWPYTNLPVTFYEEIINLTNGGVSYFDQSVPVDIPVRGGTGAGMEVTWTTSNNDYPFLGTITSIPTVSVVGAGYTDGDIITIQDNTLVYFTDPQYKSNNAAFTLTLPANVLAFQNGGSEYLNFTTYYGKSFNSSRNNVYIYFSVGAGTDIVHTAFNTVVGTTHFQDYSYYPVGTLLRPLDNSVLEQTQGLFSVNELSSTIADLNTIVIGTNYTFTGFEQVFETMVVNYNYRSPVSSYEVSALLTENVTEISQIVDYGAGNKEGDLIILVNPTSSMSSVFSFPGLPPAGQEITHGSPWYVNSLFYNTYRAGTTIDDGLIIDTKIADPLRENFNGEKLAVVNIIDTLGVPVLDTVYEAFVLAPFGSTVVPSPWYTTRHFSMWYTPTAELKVHAGGSNYTTARNVSCYNLTANSMRLRYTVVGNQITAKVTGDPLGGVTNTYGYIPDRYTFNTTTGTQLKLLDTEVPTESQEIVRLTNSNNNTDIETSVVTPGASYTDLADGDWFFQTQRLDQTNPTVNITIRTEPNNPYPTGTVGIVELLSAGTNNQEGDLILITQENSDQNCVFIYNDNLPFINLPPFASRDGFRVDSSDAAWERYSDTMSSAVNLMDKEVLIELRPTTSSTMETVYPVAQAANSLMPGTNNQYESFY